jgi:excisionase family DNA binding protein
MEQQLYSVTDAAKVLGIGRTVLFQLIGEGRLVSVRLGRRRLIPAAAIRELAERLVVEQAESNVAG